MTFKRKLLYWIGGGAILLAGIGAFAIWWIVFRGNNSPPPPNQGTQEVFIQQERGDQTDAEQTIAGVWQVNNEIGTIEEQTRSYGGYRVRERLFRIGTVDAVGRSYAVTGTMTIADAPGENFRLEQTLISVDLRELTSERPERDGAVQDSLNTSEFPFVEFSLTTPIDIPSSALETRAADGTDDTEDSEDSDEQDDQDDQGFFMPDLQGNITINGQTRPITIPVRAGLRADVIVVTGIVDIEFDDFEISTPSSVNVLDVEDKATIELLINFTRVPSPS